MEFTGTMGQRVRGHQTTLQRVGGMTSQRADHLNQDVCECGWASSVSRDAREALRSGMRHKAEMAARGAEVYAAEVPQ